MKKRLKQEDEHNIELKNNQSNFSKEKEKSNKLHIARQKFKEEKQAKEEKRKVETLIINFFHLLLVQPYSVSTILPCSFVYF